MDYASFLENVLVRRGVERDVEIMGEAAKRVSAEFRAAHDEIPWIGIVAQRNVLAHEYGDIKLDRIWRVASARIQELLPLLDALLVVADDTTS